jgi:hypothetical protein
MKIKIFKTIILSASLYGCATWSFCHGLRVFENRVLRGIFGADRDDGQEVGENMMMRRL